MLVGIGTDIIEIDRIARLLAQERFCTRIFTPQERTYLQSRGKNMAESAAGLFCAKEAAAKALGTGISGKLSWQNIEITHSETGKPSLTIHGQTQLACFVSISHCHTYATAMVIAQEKGESYGIFPH